MTAAPGPQQPDEVEALAQRLQQADPDGPYSALLDEPLEWDNEHTDRDHYRAFAAALLAAPSAQPDEDPRITAALALHSPVKWFEWKDGTQGVPDPEKPLTPFCRACTDPDLVYAVEMGDGAELSEGGLVEWPCATAALLAQPVRDTGEGRR